VAPVRLTNAYRDTVPLGWYGSLARRHLLLIAAAVLGGLLVGTAVSVLRGRVYTGTVEVIASKAPLGVLPEGSQPSSGPPPPTVDTEAQLLQSSAVLRPAARSLGKGRTAADLRKSMEIIVPQGTRALVVSLRARSASEARLGAALIARDYVALQSRLNRAQRRREQLLLENSLGRVLRGERAADDGTLGTPVERRAVRTIATALAALRTTPPQPAQLVSAPSVQVSRPNATIPPTSGALLGLLVGVSLTLVAEHRRKGNRSQTKYGYPRPAWKWIAGTSEDA
jgi:uncharacterized protein involved in exopolysaccharide biosynthesis